MNRVYELSKDGGICLYGQVTDLLRTPTDTELAAWGRYGAVSISETLVVSRHRGMQEWILEQGFPEPKVVTHMADNTPLDKYMIVVGTLPVYMAAKVSDQGAVYLQVITAIPRYLRGQELTKEQVATECDPKVVQFVVKKLSPSDNGAMGDHKHTAIPAK